MDQRIQTFVSTTRQMQSAPTESNTAHVEKELEELQQRWSDFRGKVAESRKLIELSIQYFQLVEEVNWLIGSFLLTFIMYIELIFLQGLSCCLH